MNLTVPKLRSDLVWQRQSTSEGVTYVIKDPLRNEFFHLKAAEGFIAEQLTKETNLDNLHANVEKQFDAKVSRSNLAHFIKTLDNNYLLENDRGTKINLHRHQKRTAGGLLYYRVRLLNPEKLFNWLICRIQFFFTRQFVYFSAATILAAIMVLIFNWQDIIVASSQMFKLSTIPLLIVTVFLVGTAHEFAHGLTCKHFGGEIRDMGFLLLYFQPALYCNVSDAWLFPEKSKRLWVGFAGPYFELFIGALAILLWRIIGPDTWINQVLILIIATSSVKTLINFIPLIKLDGYYLLSDYLEIPNLRSKSFTYLGNVLRRIGGKLKQLPQVTQRESRIFLIYGITALVGSFSILIYVSLQISELLVVEQQRLLFFAFTGMVGARLAHYFNGLFGHARMQTNVTRYQKTVPSTKDSHNLKGSQRSSKSFKHYFKLKKSPILKIITVGVITFLLFILQIDLVVVGPIDALPDHNADVRTKIEGIVAEVFVHEGQRVSKGQVIAKLSASKQLSELQQLNATIRQKQALLKKMLAGPTKNEIEVAKQEVKTWKDQLIFAASKRERMESLLPKHLVSRSDFDAALEQEKMAKNNLAGSESRLRVLLDGSRPEELEASKAELAGLEEQRRYLKEQLEKTEVISPAAGIVTTPTRQLISLVNNVVSEGGLIAKVYDFEMIAVQALIPEKEIADVKIGQAVSVKVRAYPNQIFYGKVIEIGTTTMGATSPTITQNDNLITNNTLGKKTNATISVMSEVDNREGLLKPGMTGMAKVYCGKYPIIELMIRRLARTMRVEFWSWW